MSVRVLSDAELRRRSKITNSWNALSRAELDQLADEAGLDLLRVPGNFYNVEADAHVISLRGEMNLCAAVLKHRNRS